MTRVMYAAAVLAALGWSMPAGHASESGWQVANLPLAAELDESETECLALNIYWEARSEPLEGQLAVAHVTINRMAHPQFPDSICEVVYQGDELTRGRCQFSWWCDGRSDRPTDRSAWQSAIDVATAVVMGEHDDPTYGALFFHHRSIRPKWVPHKRLSVRIGRHIFYR